MITSKNKNNYHSIGNLKNKDLIHSFLVAIDNENKNEIEILFNENKKYCIENDIIFEMYNKKQLNPERIYFIMKNCRKYFNILLN